MTTPPPRPRKDETMNEEEIQQELARLYDELNETDDYILAMGIIQYIENYEKMLAELPSPPERVFREVFED